MKQISILGCGWLGFPLAQSFIKKGFAVKGSTTSVAKISILKKAGISPFQITLFEDKIEGDVAGFLENSKILIIDIPPKLRGNATENFIAKIQLVIPFIEKTAVKKVLFVSSTSVYADTNSAIDETTNLFSTAKNARQLLAAEHLLQQNKNFQTTVLRFGGLIGDERNPIRFLSGKKNIENPNAPINFIHQIDCIGIINAIIEKECWKETFNGVAPQHPTRKEYYTKKALELQLPLPEFDNNKPSVGKTILSNKVRHFLNYEFQISLE